MPKFKILATFAFVGISLSGCLEGDGERALAGAAGGCLAGEILREGACVEGALVGAVGGALFDDVTGQ